MKTLSTPKRILITGASRGIGRELSRMLSERGHKVVLAARDVGALHALAAELVARGGSAEVLPMDVTDDGSVDPAIATLLANGPCDVLVNNAGSCSQEEFLAQPLAVQRAEMELNYWGAVRVTRALLPSFTHRRAGVIVSVSSLLGRIATPTMANYGATKAALELWSYALRREVERFGVKVTVFVAPHTQTEQGAGAKFEGVRSLPVTYTARELMQAIDDAPRSYAASPVYRVLFWLARLFPNFMEARVADSTRSLLTLPGEAS